MIHADPRPGIEAILRDARTLVCALFLLTVVGCSPATSTDSAASGRVNLVVIAQSSFDVHTRSPTERQQRWMRAHYFRMLTYSPYFDSRTSWYPRAWEYRDAYAIYTSADEPLLRRHPDWVLRDAEGHRLYIPFDCAGGSCPQYAADFGNPGFRRWWIRRVKHDLAHGYRGLFVDDVNMDFRVSDGNGDDVRPVDPRTGTAMTERNWRRYMAAFMVQVRRAFPDTEIVHNVIWHAGDQFLGRMPSIRRQLRAADYVNLEHGVNDRGLNGGGGPYGFETLLSFIDWCHRLDRHVILGAVEATTREEIEYALATYFLVSTGGDSLSGGYGSTPTHWWPGYEVSLGPARGPRLEWKGLVRRDFDHGLVLVNQPGARQVTVDLPSEYETLGGRPVRSVSLKPASGVVLRTR